MEALFLGVGEACDERLPNTSILIRGISGTPPQSILLDCGFTAAHSYWRYVRDPEELDALWISHFHGDHFLGLPALLLRFSEMKRRKKLTIIGQSGIESIVERAMELAYPGFLGKLTYPVKPAEIHPGTALDTPGMALRCARNGHGQRDYALKIESAGKCVFYSGDGRPTPDTLELARSCDLIIHEAFGLDDSTEGHGSINGCIDFARKAGASTLALVHLQRDVRRDRYREILEVIENARDIHVLLPEPGDVLVL